MSSRVNDEIKKEDELTEKIEKDNATIMGSSNAQEEAANRIQKTTAVLNEFSSKGITTSAAKEKCMHEIEEQLYAVPSTMIFDILLKSLQSKVDDAIFTKHTKPSSSIMEKMLEEFKELKIMLGFDLTALKVKYQNSRQISINKMEEAENYLDDEREESLNSMYFDFDDGCIVDELVAALTSKLAVEGKVNFVKQRIEEIRSQIAREESVDVEELELSIESSNQMITDTVASIQIQFAKIHRINELFKLGNMKVMRAVNNLKLEKHQQMNRALLSQTLNNTTLGLDKSNSIDVAELGQEELDLFLSMSMKGEETINEELETLLISSPITQLFSHNLSMFIKGVKSLHMLVMMLQESSIEVNPSVNLNMAMTEQFIKDVGRVRNENSKEISNMFDNIAKRNVNLTTLLRNVELIYKFIMENPLRKFMDPNRKYENKTFAEYENEYILYYRMMNFNVN